MCSLVLDVGYSVHGGAKRGAERGVEKNVGYSMQHVQLHWRFCFTEKGGNFVFKPRASYHSMVHAQWFSLIINNAIWYSMGCSMELSFTQ